MTVTQWQIVLQLRHYLICLLVTTKVPVWLKQTAECLSIAIFLQDKKPVTVETMTTTTYAMLVFIDYRVCLCVRACESTVSNLIIGMWIGAPSPSPILHVCVCVCVCVCTRMCV